VLLLSSSSSPPHHPSPHLPTEKSDVIRPAGAGSEFPGLVSVFLGQGQVIRTWLGSAGCRNAESYRRSSGGSVYYSIARPRRVHVNFSPQPRRPGELGVNVSELRKSPPSLPAPPRSAGGRSLRAVLRIAPCRVPRVSPHDPE
jgi:hypothetical protein